LSRAVRALVALALAVAATPARAQLYDPAFRWRTLETPHFRVHYHQGEEELAQDVAREAERAHQVLSPLLGHAPRERTEVALSDDTDDANGSATPLPYNLVRLYAVPPPGLSELNEYRDWLASLVFHEYVHILHLDQVGGIPGGLNTVFGRVFFPNGLVPGWMVEGLAVLHESDGEGDPEAAGRNASALMDAYARALATEPPRFPRLDEASNPYLEWPVGNVPYLLGGRFMAFLRGRYGDDALRGYLGDQGAQLWPYAPSWASERWFAGKDFRTLWAEYAAAERARFDTQLAEIRRRPVTAVQRLTTEGGRIGAPRWSPDGTFVALYRRSLDRRPSIRLVAPDGRELRRLEGVEANGALAVVSPSEAVVAAGEIWREHRLYDDLWRLDLRTGSRTRLTDGARATDPAVSPDGARLVYVRRLPGGRMALVARPLAGGAEEVLFERPGAQVYAPAVAADGRIAFEVHADGQRDVFLWERGEVRRITDDAANDGAPAWTPDGRSVLFHSDRTGVYDLYAWEAATGTVRQVTNVESGAFQPSVSPDGKTVAFVTYSRSGFDLATVPLEPERWVDPGPRVSTTWAEANAPASGGTAAPTATPTAAATSTEPSPPAPLPSRPYAPWRTLAPHWWLPLIGGDGAGPILGALTGGTDVLAQHSWLAEAWWSLDGHEPGYFVSYVGGWSWPQLDLSSSRFLDSAPGGDGLETVTTPLAAGLDLTFDRLAGTLALRLGWSGTSYDAHGVSGTASSPELLGLRDGFLSELSFLAEYTDARRFQRSISAEEGRAVSLLLAAADPALGSDFSVTRARAAVSQYLRLPGTTHGVLALRLAGGAAEGSIGGRAPFELGGVGQADPLSLLLGTSTGPSDQLRGYPSGWFAGTGYVLANTELRFPLSVLALGRTTWPIFVRRLHGAVFADLGETFDAPDQLPFARHPFEADRLHLGAGAELRAELALGYWLVTDLRLGVAHAFGRVFQGQAQAEGVDPVSVYLTLGTSF
jgi:Tol biopolymer transport system component